MQPASSDVKFTGYPSGVSVMDWWEEEPEIGDPGLTSGLCLSGIF